MVLRFEVDQAEAFRQGINVPKSTNHLDIDPATLTQDERILIADRLSGIDVMRLSVTAFGEARIPTFIDDGDPTHGRIVAKAPTYEALIAAIREDQTFVKRSQGRQAGVAVNLIQKRLK